MTLRPRRPRLAPKARLRWDAVACKHLLLFPERSLLLDDVAWTIVRMCDGTRTCEEIVVTLIERYGTDDLNTRNRIASETFALLDDLATRRLLTDATDTYTPQSADRGPTADPLHTNDNGPRPFTLIAELSYRCPLHCVYCSNPLNFAEHTEELEADEWMRVLGEAAVLGVVHVHFTGGEPLVRKDLKRLVVHARSLGLYSNLITSGIPLRKERLFQLRESGLDHVQLSLQGVDAGYSKQIAGRDVFSAKLDVARWVKEAGLPLTLNVVLHRHNLDHVAAIVELAERLGAERLELANTQYHGFALKNREQLLPTQPQLDRAFDVAQAARERLRGIMEIAFVRPDYFTDRPRACMDGWARRFIHMMPDGTVLPCHAAMGIKGMSFENVRARSLDDIWRYSPSFAAFRGETWMTEPCRSCDQRTVDFGGCRCQAFALTGDATATDPACSLSPHHDLVRIARRSAETETNRRRFLYRGRSR